MSIPVSNLLGIEIANISRDSAISHLLNTIRRGGFVRLAFCNAHTANVACENSYFRDLLKHFFVLPDGIGVDVGRKILVGDKFIANLNGTDLTPALFQHAKEPLHIAMLGAEPGIADLAAQIWSKQFPQHRFRVVSDGFFSKEQEADVLKALITDRPDILLVAMGNPRQEIWIGDNIRAEHASLAIGIGALFDFTAGKVERAPAWMRSARIEWCYRLIQEPQRLWRRYVIGNPLFLFRIAKQKLFGLKTG